MFSMDFRSFAASPIKSACSLLSVVTQLLYLILKVKNRNPFENGNTEKCRSLLIFPFWEWLDYFL
jgi:hypothetical protein